jgi:hypothetical protein
MVKKERKSEVCGGNHTAIYRREEELHPRSTLIEPLEAF